MTNNLTELPKCNNCAAPLTQNMDESGLIKCEYCGSKYFTGNNPPISVREKFDAIDDFLKYGGCLAIEDFQDTLYLNAYRVTEFHGIITPE